MTTATKVAIKPLEDRIVVQAPGESDPAQLERVIGQTAQLTFQMVDTENSVQDAVADHTAMVGAVHRDAVVPDDDIATPPVMTIQVCRSDAVAVQRSDKPSA